MSQFTCYYRCTSQCEESTYEFSRTDRDWSDDFWKEALLDGVAEDYFSNHDGWESNWPLNFEVFYDQPCTNLIAKGRVDMEAVPTFTSKLNMDGGE